MNSPCKECKKHKAGCHNVDTCKPWREYVEKVREANEKRQEARINGNDWAQHVRRHGAKIKER